MKILSSCCTGSDLEWPMRPSTMKLSRENEETKALEEEVKDDVAISKMLQEEVLTKAVMSLLGFTDEA